MKVERIVAMLLLVAMTLMFGCDNEQPVVEPDEIVVDYSFEAEIVEREYHYCTLDLRPESDEYYFLMDLYLMEDVEANGLHDDDALFNYQMDSYASLGSWSGMSSLEIAADRARKGAQGGIKLSGLMPDTKCLFVAFYYDPVSGARLSDVYRYEFTTKVAPKIELSFENRIDVDGSVAVIGVTPDRMDVRYYYDVMSCGLVDEACQASGMTVEEYIEDWWKHRVSEDLQGGNTTTAICEERCSVGVDSYTFNLMAETDYYLFQFGVNDEAVCNTVPQIEVFRTGEVELSDLRFELSVSNVTKCGVKVTIDASNDTDPYVAGLTTRWEWDSFGRNNAERLPEILQTYSFTSLAYGDGLFEEMTALDADTEYVFFVFGYQGGVATTELYAVEFKTLEDRASDITISVKDLGYYDVAYINAFDPSFGYLTLDDEGYALMPIEFDVSGSADIYFYVWPITPDYDLDWVTDANRFGRMLYWRERPEVLWTIVPYGCEAWIGAVAKDEDGYYSEQYLEKRTITRSGVSPVKDFLEWYQAHPEVAPDPSQYIDELYGD